MQIRFLITSIVIFVAGLFIIGCADAGSSPTSANQDEPPPPPATQAPTFQTHIKPIFQQRGCTGCHGGSGGLFVQTVAQLLQGGDHGPAIVPGKADESNLIKKLSSNPPFGDRMPQGGPYLPDTTIQIIRNWINQGAKDN